eukprot:CAMPEP_0170501208 /NCGR_PEP_ID=MMETSP0208-20121228/37580_1 /TAXON_ID=197538 /ORGANISM="Strombidium inclinatum, Strain S3" /LENGTH=37 /DNA_ID= /DNA_START= /DNA_END= /DNA_ORIENTATION=
MGFFALKSQFKKVFIAKWADEESGLKDGLKYVLAYCA